ncbi:hypothetical protein T265_08996 [Opisthorchis viverrini]|uniref:Uncharacterized protein n=1 Tax=Opisthorchis viverrini TaxID=6198 RepID=A0A074Z7H0_OPIVI|nr:hypothetical protein T265_08996 [Opisthorchis viverrini]KER23053.1 hypothetical protein T265_08996 [Opisthorchis viverrini]
MIEEGAGPSMCIGFQLTHPRQTGTFTFEWLRHQDDILHQHHNRRSAGEPGNKSNLFTSLAELKRLNFTKFWKQKLGHLTTVIKNHPMEVFNFRYSDRPHGRGHVPLGNPP